MVGFFSIPHPPRAVTTRGPVPFGGAGAGEQRGLCIVAIRNGGKVGTEQARFSTGGVLICLIFLVFCWVDNFYSTCCNQHGINPIRQVTVGGAGKERMAAMCLITNTY